MHCTVIKHMKSMLIIRALDWSTHLYVCFVEVLGILELGLLAEGLAKDDVLLEQKYDQLLSFEVQQ